MTRELCINKLNELFDKLNVEKYEDLSKNIEASIYDYTVEQSKVKCIDENIDDKYFRRIYVNKLLTIYTNLDPASYVKNKDFLNKLIRGEIDIKKIAFLTPQDIHNEHWKVYIDRQSATDEFINNRVAGIKTNEYKCHRCKSKDCTYYQLQVRCSDEPMTTFINCLNCGNRWHFNG